MHANVGDLVYVYKHQVGQEAYAAEIIEIRGQDGAPPYLVMYPDGHHDLVFPGPDAVIKPKV
ncbi:MULTISPECIES: DUF1918 domain-containing protein [unclassified Streptomyces]|uniref:DUF1918 domain-containing protein n=1 Tax=unclassified Streptomyces TaxID=2593676 RepID=UPI0004C23EC2|nr:MULTISPECIES: DUF1918 domain-containing protein [unclassified Streptomyces]